MEFLKRHYEKLILLALSVISLFAVLYMASVIGDTKEVTDRDLKIPTRSPDYKTLDEQLKRYGEAPAEDKEKFSDVVKMYADTDKFNAEKLIETTPLKWTASTRRTANAPGNAPFSDLVAIFKMARCPHCERIVPYDYFLDSHCPTCKGELKKPSGRAKRALIITAEDSDGDGISDSDEERYNFDKNDAGDALLDADGDGFSNVFEILSQTDPRNPNSCPPHWYRLRFYGMDRVELPIRLTSVDTGDKPDPKNWEALIKMETRNMRTGRLVKRDDNYRIGDELLDFEGRNYRIVAMAPEKRVEKGEGGLEKVIDSYSVTMREVRSEEDANSKEPLDELKLVLGQPVYSPDRRVILEDIGYPTDANGKRPAAAYQGVRKDGMCFVGGVSAAGRNMMRMSFKLVKFDERGKKAFLEFGRGRSGADQSMDAGGQRMEVTADSEIPEDMWVTSPQLSGEGNRKGKARAVRKQRKAEEEEN